MWWAEAAVDQVKQGSEGQPSERALALQAVRRWAVLLCGPIVWMLHFGLVYAAASIALTLAPTTGWATRAVIAAGTLVALAVVGWTLVEVRRGRWPRWESAGEDLRALWRRVTLWLCLLSLAAIIWQALPVLVIPDDPGGDCEP